MSINREGGFGDTEPMPQTDKFPCVECGAVFLSRQDLEHHKDMGHYVGKPQFFLRNRELLEQIEFVHEVFPVSDWKIVNAGSISLNGKLVTERELFERLANSKNSFLDIVLTNASFDQTMHYKIDIKIADISEVDEVTRIFRETFLAKDSAEDLSTSSFTNFFARCSHLVSAEKYASGLHSFLIAHLDKLQKYDSTEFLEDHYRTQIQRAGATMVRFNSSTPYNSELAEVICAIIAFDENEFGIAGQRKGSPAISSAANRLLRIREHSDSSSPVSKPSQVEQFMFTPDKSLLLEFCSIPLDGSAQAKVEEIESRLAEGFADKDLVKLHAVLSAHYFVVRDKSNLMRHLARLRNTAAWTNWADWAEKEIISDGK